MALLAIADSAGLPTDVKLTSRFLSDSKPLDEAMTKAAKKVIPVTGFGYGLALAFYALAWGVDGPTLTMPLAASPLNLPAVVLESQFALTFVMPVLVIVPLLAAPFCWAWLALCVASAQTVHRRIFLGSVLLSHYLGIAVWFAIVGSKYLLRPFRLLVLEGALLLAFYAAGQILIWWALLRPKSQGLRVVTP